MEGAHNHAVSSGKLIQNLLLFGRLLRKLGLQVYPSRMISLVRGLSYIDIGRKSDFYYATRCILVQDKEELHLFDQAFELFWRVPDGERFELILTKARDARENARTEKPDAVQDSSLVSEQMDDDKRNQAEPIPLFESTKTYSTREILRQKDFAELSDDELNSIKRIMQEFVWQLGQRRTRRKQIGPGIAIDMRRSLRRNISYGGEILKWSYQRPKIRPRPLVILADISGSMESYTRLLLHFVYSLHNGLEQPVETFVFGTRLTRITRVLREQEVDRAMADISQTVPDWSGGTRIGETIKIFNYHWARRVLGHGAVVLLISDGWDRGDPELLSKEIAHLQRCCKRLIWLNPLLGLPGYEPLTRGMVAALPYIDDFLPIHNLASVEDLALKLQLVGGRRPVRRQAPAQPHSMP